MLWRRDGDMNYLRKIIQIFGNAEQCDQETKGRETRNILPLSPDAHWLWDHSGSGSIVDFRRPEAGGAFQLVMHGDIY
jgi:hypothetical protein